MEEEKKKDNKKIIAIVLVVLLVAFGALFIYRNYSSNSSTNSNSKSSEKNMAAISGSLDINGVLPEGSVLSLVSVEFDSSETPTEFDSITDPKDQDTWELSDANSGKIYVIQGILKSSSGEELAKSNKITVSAPASNEVLTLNVVGKGLTGEAVVSGLIKVNGAFPQGSTVNLLVRTPNTQFTETREGLPAKAETYVSNTTAVAGQAYDVVGYLYDATGAKIGESEILSLVAPAKNEVLVINSSFNPPVPTSAPKPNADIQGSIDLNGAVPSNSRIVVLEAPMNSNSFEVAVDNIPAQDGQGWIWNGATQGTWYNLQAVLKQRQDNGTDKDIAKSQQMTVAAPAINVTFTIDTGIALPPTPTPSQ